jgi:DNA modification methylase
MTATGQAAWPADRVERRRVADLIPYARNARSHPPEQIEQIAASIRQWGWTVAILIDEAGGIIAGEARLIAAQRLGIEEVPVVVARGWSDAQKRAYAIADNKLAENSSWNEELLRLELADLMLVDFEMPLIGFSADELAAIFADKTDGLTDPDAAPGAPVNPVTIEGDVWLLGRHRIVCGDSTKAEVVAKALNGAKPHLMVTDPPYGVEYDPGWRNGVTRANGSVVSARATGKVLNDDKADWREAWELFPGSVCYIWHAGLFAATVMESLIATGFQVRSQIVWVKSRFALSRGHYHWQHEPAWYAVKPGEPDHWRFEDDHASAAYAVKKGASADWKGGRKQSTVWEISHSKCDTGHGTQKPVECMKRPIENNSDLGDAIYEPFSGSGTTLIACEMSGRACHAIELNPAYVDVAVQRWESFTGKKATLEADGRTFFEVSDGRYDAGDDSRRSYDAGIGELRKRAEAAE